ncbi:hypothetical protein ACJX0J_034193, partial [Zea mays]
HQLYLLDRSSPIAPSNACHAYVPTSFKYTDFFTEFIIGEIFALGELVVSAHMWQMPYRGINLKYECLAFGFQIWIEATHNDKIVNMKIPCCITNLSIINGQEKNNATDFGNQFNKPVVGTRNH